MRLINSLLNSNFTHLHRLALGGNYEWFDHEDAAGYLWTFIMSQTSLETLIIGHNYLSSDRTEALFA